MKRIRLLYLSALALSTFALIASQVAFNTPARAQTPAGMVATVPLYRNTVSSEFSLTRPADDAKDPFTGGSVIIGYALKDEIPNAVPLYKLVNMGIKSYSTTTGEVSNPTVYTTDKELAERLARDGFTGKDSMGNDYRYDYKLVGVVCYLASKKLEDTKPLYAVTTEPDGTVMSFSWPTPSGGFFGGNDPFKRMQDAERQKSMKVVGYFWSYPMEVPRMALMGEMQVRPGPAVPKLPTPSTDNNRVIKRPPPRP